MNKKEYRGIITGMVLGDGNLTMRDCYKNPSIRINHSSKQKFYLLWKIGLLQGMFHYKLLDGFKEKTITNRQNGKVYDVCNFSSRVSPKLKTVYKALYGKEKQKHITRKALDYLTPFGISIWYMDDGCLNRGNRTISISTYTTREENEVCQKYFEEKWNIHWHIGKHYDKYFLVRGSKSEDMARFIELIKPYIFPLMNYKINTAATTSYDVKI